MLLVHSIPRARSITQRKSKVFETAYFKNTHTFSTFKDMICNRHTWQNLNREEALEAIKGVRWLPASGQNRISRMTESRTDWCISRQRKWGVPIPVFYDKESGVLPPFPIAVITTVVPFCMFYDNELAVPSRFPIAVMTTLVAVCVPLRVCGLRDCWLFGGCWLPSWLQVRRGAHVRVVTLVLVAAAVSIDSVERRLGRGGGGNGTRDICRVRK